ncbi:MAG: fructose-1,6-bisphosphate aldolase/phosphatase [Dichotomicrobium sp.]
MADLLTLSVIKADVGGYVGHSTVHPQLLETARARVEEAVGSGLLIDGHVTNCGDDLELIMTHRRGADQADIHQFAWDTFLACTEVARSLKLYGAGQDLLSDAFSGNVKGMGPGVAEMEIEERPAETIVIFMADKTSPGAWNLPLFQIYANPFNSPGLVIDTKMHQGFEFEVLDVFDHKSIRFVCPEEMYEMLMFIGAPRRYMIKTVHRRMDGLIAASASTQRLSLIAGKYVGKDDPVLVTRCQSGLPALGETLEPFTFAHIVEGWMRGSHHGPLMPVSFAHATPSRFDGPPRVIAAGFQIAEGKLVGPRDLFDDPAFDLARTQANETANYLRRHGPFEPHRLGLDDMEYTTMPHLMEKLEDRWTDETDG